MWYFKIGLHYVSASFKYGGVFFSFVMPLSLIVLFSATKLLVWVKLCMWICFMFLPRDVAFFLQVWFAWALYRQQRRGCFWLHCAVCRCIICLCRCTHVPVCPDEQVYLKILHKLHCLIVTCNAVSNGNLHSSKHWFPFLHYYQVHV